jgi:Fe-S-cluster containining protein
MAKKKTDDHAQLEDVDPETFSAPVLTDNPFYCVQKCSGFCCSEYTVLITILDVQRILKNIPPLHPYQFCTIYDAEVETLGFYPKVMIEGEEKVIGMINDEKHHTCPFHTALGLCGIHNFSPMVCQTYPFTLTEDGELTYVSKTKCPKLYPPMDEEGTAKCIKQAWEEVDQYKAMVEEWNSTNPNGTLDEFMVFTGTITPEMCEYSCEEDY